MRESRTPCNAATFHCTTTLSLSLDWPNTPTGQIRTATVSRHRKYTRSLALDVNGRAIPTAIGILPPAILAHRIYPHHLFVQLEYLAHRDSLREPPHHHPPAP